jgi:VIT1/CCC1 family predicted Fe2+/Mn2+ transporter
MAGRIITEDLEAEHAPPRIRERLRGGARPQFVSDTVLGGIDGCVTSFAVVCGAVGAGFSTTVALILGLANLVADGFSMAVSNYQAEKAREAHRKQARAEEDRHIDSVPEGEREEVRQIFASKGFAGETLDRVVEVITSDREVWLKTMLSEEHGISHEESYPIRSALMTFAGFAFGGIVPLMPLFTAMSVQSQFWFSASLAGVTFFAIGSLRSMAFKQPILRSALSTLLSGTTAAGLAYATGYALRHAFGI